MCIVVALDARERLWMIKTNNNCRAYFCSCFFRSFFLSFFCLSSQTRRTKAHLAVISNRPKLQIENCFDSRKIGARTKNPRIDERALGHSLHIYIKLIKCVVSKRRCTEECNFYIKDGQSWCVSLSLHAVVRWYFCASTTIAWMNWITF